MKRAWLLAAVLYAPAAARAGGFEHNEQSAVGTATAGAQTAASDEPAAIYYNPAALAFHRGLGVQGGANVLVTDLTVKTAGASYGATGLTGTPTVYVSQRLGPHFAVGVGVFSNFAEHLEYAADWPGRQAASFFDLTTTTINPSVAIRPIPQISIGFGLDVVPASLNWQHTFSVPGGEQLAHSGSTAVGLGGNLGVQFRAVPRYLILAATYRSSIDLDFAGPGGLDANGAPLDFKLTLPLPHNFGFGVASHPVDGLTLSFDARLTVWHDLSGLNASFAQPGADATVMPTRDSLPLQERDGYGFRLGVEHRVLIKGEERLRLRAGVGYDRTPVRRGWLLPLTPDNDRVIVGAGAGYHHGPFGLDVGYSAQIILARTSSNPDPGAAEYSGLRHVISATVSLRLEELGGRINVPEYKR